MLIRNSFPIPESRGQQVVVIPNNYVPREASYLRSGAIVTTDPNEVGEILADQDLVELIVVWENNNLGELQKIINGAPENPIIVHFSSDDIVLQFTQFLRLDDGYSIDGISWRGKEVLVRVEKASGEGRPSVDLINVLPQVVEATRYNLMSNIQERWENDERETDLEGPKDGKRGIIAVKRTIRRLLTDTYRRYGQLVPSRVAAYLIPILVKRLG